MMRARLVIVDDEPITRLDIRDIVEQANYQVVGEAGDGFEAVETCQKERPDLVIMDIRMPLLDGLKAGKKIMDDQLTNGIIYLSAYSDDTDMQSANNIGAVGYLVKPLAERSLLTTITVGLAQSNRTKSLFEKMDFLSSKLEQRKVIERAKGVLMEENKLTEDAAYKMLRNLSMTKRCPMNDLAELIVMNA